MEKLSIHRAFAGKTLLLTGASGFLGKVWLAMALERIPEIEKIYVLVRRKGEMRGWDRFEKIVETSPAFLPLHRRHGSRLAEFLGEKVEILEGDVSIPGLDLSPAIRNSLADIDLVLNSAGLVDFEPDLREAFATNVQGLLNVLEFTQTCRRAALLHVSTCYVVGKMKAKQAEERLVPDYSPAGAAFDAESEYRWLREETSIAGGNEASWIEKGRARAARWGWPNAYTYSKSLAESLLLRRAGKTRFAVVRPAVVESALEFPFPGWNEGAQTCAPLSYLMGSWLRFFPIQTDHVLDVIPVDYICRALALAGAELLSGRGQPVYQAGTSGRNPLKLERMLDLINLAHRRHWQSQSSPLERMLLSRWDSVAVGLDSWLGPKRIQEGVAKAIEWMRPIKESLPSPLQGVLKETIGALSRSKWALLKADKIIQVFLPFIYHTDFRFVCEALEEIEVAEAEFRFRAQDIEWRDYMLNIHEPGLRKWCFPILEGKPVETLKGFGPLHLMNRRAEPVRKLKRVH